MNTRSPLVQLAKAPPWAIAILCAWGLLTNWAIVRTWTGNMWTGVQDFTALYAGGRLSGTGKLYSNPALHAVERQLVGTESADFHYVRLPAVALAYKPLTLIPYRQALAAWKILSILGFAAVAWILPFPNRRVTCVAVAVSLGASNTLLYGQDVWVTLLLIAAFIRFMDQGRDRKAGIFLGLAVTMQYHLFPLPLLALAVCRKWKTLSSAAIALGSALVLSFVVEGMSWPRDYAHVLIGKGAVLAQYMPNLGGFVALAGLGIRTYLCLAGAVAFTIAIIARRSSATFAFGVALFAGILIAPHGYPYDYAIFLAALLPLAAKHPWFEYHCVWWLMPFPLIPLVSGLGLIGQMLIMVTGAATLYSASQFATREGVAANNRLAIARVTTIQLRTGSIGDAV